MLVCYSSNNPNYLHLIGYCLDKRLGQGETQQVHVCENLQVFQPCRLVADVTCKLKMSWTTRA